MNIAQAIKNRWSPRAFSNKPVTNEMINQLKLHDRLLQQGMNNHGYTFMQKKDENNFTKILDCLYEGNQIWAINTQILII